MERIDFVIELANFRVRSASPNDCVVPIRESTKTLQQSLLSRSDVRLSFGVCGDRLFLIDLRKPGKTSRAFAGPVSYLVGNFSSAV